MGLRRFVNVTLLHAEDIPSPAPDTGVSILLQFVFAMAADLPGSDVDLAAIKTAMESVKSDSLPQMTFFDKPAGSMSAPAAMHFLGPATKATALTHFIDFIADCEIKGDWATYKLLSEQE